MTKEKIEVNNTYEPRSPSYLISHVESKFVFPEIQDLKKSLTFSRPSVSAPHSRSCSIRKVKRDSSVQQMDNRRRNSLPNDYLNSQICAKNSEPEEPPLQRVRSFKVTSKGIINHGDSFRNKNKSRCGSNRSSVKSTGRQRMYSDTSDDTCSTLSSCSNVSNSYYRIVIMGSQSVGKTALVNQFMTSEYTGALEANSVDDGMTVSVLLDGEESTLEFSHSEEDQDVGDCFFDAFVIVFSVDDTHSFQRAHAIICFLRNDVGSDRPIILVANKIDLVRNRKVSPQEASEIACQYDAKYIETSVTLHHHVDELLVGILRQIRIKLNVILPESVNNKVKKHCTTKGPKGLLKKIFRLDRKNTGSCENVFDF